MENATLVSHVVSNLGMTNYAVESHAGKHVVACDEPVHAGGGGTAAAPFDILLSALGSCTVITLRMYAERKQWSAGKISADLHMTRAADKSLHIHRVLSFEGPLDAEQIARLADIAERTPVTLAIKTGVPIATTVKP